ncbi:MAG: alpha-ribazole phosphatase [Actinomycetota bacterium]|nr:alpha-ribazole phosphatase [Actinomycetota bacterium]
MTRLYLVRHGETEWNAQGKYLGVTDIPLTLRGRSQALALGRYLEDKGVSAAYSSELKRAKETLKIATSALNINPSVLNGLNEINFGRWEGMTYEEIERSYGDLLSNWLLDVSRYEIPDGERWHDFKSRVSESFDRIIEENQEREVLVVTHGGVIKTIIGSILGMEPVGFWKLRQDKGALNILEVHRKEAMVTLLNDTCYQNHI